MNSNSYQIDHEWLDKAISWFVDYVKARQDSKEISFDSGWLKRTEGYKNEIFENAHGKLDVNSWTREEIGSGHILDRVMMAYNAKDNKGFNNILQFQSITRIRTIGEAELSRAEDILYRIYTEDDPQTAFGDAIDLWGKRYPELSYLLFMKDRDKYLPVKTTHHAESFRKLKISTDCLERCSWENYSTFNDIHQVIKDRVEHYLGISISLLDAHSFVWIAQSARDDLSLGINDPLFPKSIINNGDDYDVVCARCGEMFRKAKRCTFCGQLLHWPSDEDIKQYIE